MADVDSAQSAHMNRIEHLDRGITECKARVDALRASVEGAKGQPDVVASLRAAEGSLRSMQRVRMIELRSLRQLRQTLALKKFARPGKR
jgi:hypothetical protein